MLSVFNGKSFSYCAFPAWREAIKFVKHEENAYEDFNGRCKPYIDYEVERVFKYIDNELYRTRFLEDMQLLKEKVITSLKLETIRALERLGVEEVSKEHILLLDSSGYKSIPSNTNSSVEHCLIELYKASDFTGDSKQYPQSTMT